MTSFLSINVILSCPNLKHLFISERRTFSSKDDYTDLSRCSSSCSIMDFLSRRPAITLKLETFEWQEDDDEAKGCWSPLPCMRRSRELQQRMIADLGWHYPIPRPFLQFGDRLKSLHWNVLHSKDGVSVLFPGVLEQVAGSLRKLDLRVVRTRPGRVSPQNPIGCRLGLPYCLTNLNLPSMPKLSTLQIGFRDCCIVSLNELVDAAPNLSTLEISACGSCAYGWEEMPDLLEDLWEARPSEEPHYNLKCLKSGLTLWNTRILRRAVNKFPNLEELWISVQSDCNDRLFRDIELKLDGIFRTLKKLKSLKRFDWTTSGSVDVFDVLGEVAVAGKRMRSLQSCHFHVASILCPFYPEDSDAVEIERFISRTSHFLEKIFVTQMWVCNFIVTARYEDIFETEGNGSSFPPALDCTWKDQLLPFIKEHRLPIEFRYSSSDIY
jgi:hypothetical protein